jgi:CBS domain-containing protein
MRSTVEDVMTTQVVAVREDASFKEMITRMRDARISAFPVIDHAGKVIGVVSEADMLNKEADQASPGTLASLLRFRDHEKASGVTAADLMTSPAVTIGPDEPGAAAATIRGHLLPLLRATQPARFRMAVARRELTDFGEQPQEVLA